MDVSAGVTQEGHTGFLIHFPSAVLALIFFAIRIQPFLSLVDSEVVCKFSNDHYGSYSNFVIFSQLTGGCSEGLGAF